MNRLPQKSSRALMLCLLVLIMLAPGLLPAYGSSSSFSPVPDDRAMQIDHAGIQTQMTALINYLDSPAYAATTTWEEHIVLAYQLAQQRPPTPLEFLFLNLYRQHEPVSRGFALSVALRGQETETSWEQCAAFLRRVTQSDWAVTPLIRAQAAALSTVPRSYLAITLRQQIISASREPAIATPLTTTVTQPYTEYNIYYGYLHAHSELSDGQGNPLDDYVYARDQGGLDYFSLTDHGELLLIWPWQHKWQDLKDAAEATYAPGQFATLWGFEWSNPILGHINVLNSEDYTNALSDFGLVDLFDYLVARPEAFGRFNHPGEYDYLFIEFLHLRLNAAAVPQMVIRAPTASRVITASEIGPQVLSK